MAKITPISIGAGTVDDIRVQVTKAFRDICQILLNISPLDNFNGFLYEGVIGATTEVKIPHRLKRVPTGYLIIFNQGGQIRAGDAAWTSQFVYLKNINAVAVTVKVFFFT